MTPRPGSGKGSRSGALRPCPAMRAALTLQSLREVVKSLVDTPGFDRVYDKIKLLSAIPGKVVCEMKVEEQHTNRAGTLHGGLAATLVDVVSTVALMNTERGEPGVSVDMNITLESCPLPVFHRGDVVSMVNFCSKWVKQELCQLMPSLERYISAPKMGEEILITSQVMKQGRRIAFTTTDLTKKATGKIVAQGRHTKYLGP
ncbi:acyl-coenzyme A thioesterase 13-like isoform X1 [Alligator sinensis]|uniref:Acyl-coenzyme A thioesterase 13-like isoform X1 n=1 Tax=Alligator sinensis TaxID=38654 RepID=A0A3Q0HNN7_ALLSI|nr:acyl-coenzyme A thioesterase 13-like isoform X1 [Alligator sinensis]